MAATSSTTTTTSAASTTGSVTVAPATGSTKIMGYRDLTPAQISLMNEGKSLAVQVGIYVDKVNASTPAVDARWSSIGKTQLQQGFMSLLRSIAQPTTF